MGNRRALERNDRPPGGKFYRRRAGRAAGRLHAALGAGIMVSGRVGAASAPGAAIESPAVNVRQRHSARRLTAGQLRVFRQAISTAQGVEDDRGYQHFVGIHGLPLPAYCTHNSPLFLAWHRAYLYFFERALQDLVPGVILPWWDWTIDVSSEEAIPFAYRDEQDADGQPNPLRQSPNPTGRKATQWT